MNSKHGMRGGRDTRGQVRAEKEFHRKWLERQKQQRKANDPLDEKTEADGSRLREDRP
jgi:hypothetical protein